MTDASSQRFSSRWALLLSVLGIAVGTGNIWRFPRIVASNGTDDGAGGFLLMWLICLLCWSIPLIIAEYMLGQKGRMGVIGTFAKIAGPKLAWMGGFVGLVAAAIMCYYAVITGWCFFYFGSMLFSDLPVSTEAAMTTWDTFQASGSPIIFHLLAIGLAALACWKGVQSIEKANSILVPTLLVIVVIAVIRAVTLPGAGAGLSYLFTPDFSQFRDPRIWLEALTQNAWDTGAGWGLVLTYGAYMRKDQGVVKNAFITGIGNNTVSILSAIMIFGTVFAILGIERSSGEILDIMRESGPASTGLTFIWLPQLFAEMAFGRVLAVLFFLALSFAAFSSLISMVEMASRVLVDFGITRKRAVMIVAVAGFGLGIPSALNLTFLANQDFVWGVGLMISGAFVALAVIIYGSRKLRDEFTSAHDWRLGLGWDLLIRVLVPLQAAILLIWWLQLAASPDFAERWYDPFEPFSAMTVLAQWAIALTVLILANRWMVKHLVDLDRYNPE